MAPKHEFLAKTFIEDGRIEAETFLKLKEWSLEQKYTFTDEQLILFILSCFGVLEAAQRTIQQYIKCRNSAPELFANRNFYAEDIQQAMKISEASVSPTRTKDNDIIVIWRLKDTCYYRFNLEAAMKLLLMVAELSLYQQPPNGVIAIFDLSGVGLLHLTRLSIGPIKKFLQYVQEGYPCKLKQIHIVNTVYFIDKIMFIFKPFISDELYKKIKFHPASMTNEEFFHFVPKETLPQDYGGPLANHKVLTLQTYNAFKGLTKFYKEEEEQIKLMK